jgi:hypothetical protein
VLFQNKTLAPPGGADFLPEQVDAAAFCAAPARTIR